MPELQSTVRLQSDIQLAMFPICYVKWAQSTHTHTASSTVTFGNLAWEIKYCTFRQFKYNRGLKQ